MSHTLTQLPEHPMFDALCSEVSDWEPLPTVLGQEDGEDATLEERQSNSLDRLILAGLITPY
jgi:hypothetical protein